MTHTRRPSIVPVLAIAAVVIIALAAIRSGHPPSMGHIIAGLVALGTGGALRGPSTNEE